MHFTEELGHFQLLLNLFQIQRTRILIDTDVSPSRVELFVGNFLILPVAQIAGFDRIVNSGFGKPDNIEVVALHSG